MNAHFAPPRRKRSRDSFTLFAAVLVSAAVTVASAISASSAEDPSSAGVTVRVRDRGGRAVPSARILRRTGDDTWGEVGVTGGDGTAVLTEATTDGSWIVGAWAARGTPSTSESLLPVPVTSRLVDLALDYGTILRVDVVDAETGAAVQGVDWCLSAEDKVAGHWTASGDARWAPFDESGYWWNKELSVRLVPALRDQFWVSPEGSPRMDSERRLVWSSALEQRIVLPMRRRAILDVELWAPKEDDEYEEDGEDEGYEERIVPASWQHWHFDDGTSRPDFDWISPYGRRDRPWVSWDVPFYRGGRLYVVAQSDERGFAWTRLITLPQGPPTQPILVSIIAADELPPSGPSPVLYGVGGRLRYGRSTVEITMLRSGGGPAANCLMEVVSDEVMDDALRRYGLRVPWDRYKARTDAAGVLRVPGLCKGGYTVRSIGDRFVAASTYVVVDGSDTVTEVELREPRGVTIDVVVVDASGKPLPFAAVEVHGPVGGRGDVGVEPHRIDPYVDLVGRRRFLRVDPGAVTVRAEWGAWRMSTNVYVEDGGRAEARLVYDPPNR